MDPGELPPSQVDKGFMREGVDATSGKRKIDTLTATDNAKAQRLQAKVQRIATMQQGWESWQQWAEVGTPGTWGKELNRPPPINLPNLIIGGTIPLDRWLGHATETATPTVHGETASTTREWVYPSSWRFPSAWVAPWSNTWSSG